MKFTSFRVPLVLTIILFLFCVSCGSTPISIRSTDKGSVSGERAFISFGSNIISVKVDGVEFKLPKSRIISVAPGEHSISCGYVHMTVNSISTTNTYTSDSFGFVWTKNFEAENYYSIYVLWRRWEEGRPPEYMPFLSWLGRSSELGEDYAKVVIRRDRSILGFANDAHIIIDGVYWVDLQMGKEAEIYLATGKHKIISTSYNTDTVGFEMGGSIDIDISIEGAQLTTIRKIENFSITESSQ